MNIGFLLMALLKLVLVVAALVGFLLLVIGLPVGIILLIIKRKFKGIVMWLIIGGPILLFGSFTIWALISMLGVVLGFGISTSLLK